jgi:translation initiation factor IF-1
MSREDYIEVEGTVIEAVSGSVFRVGFENGHRVTGFLGRKAGPGLAGLSPGDKVAMRLSPFDLSKGRIVGVVSNEKNL